MATTFDVLIVGAGTAGCVLAARLSEDPHRRVCLVEAGGRAGDPDIADPAQWPFLAGRSYDWAYRTLPQPGTNGRTHDWPRGRILGGSSCLNAMAHVRGHARDFDAWAEAGGPLWSFEALLPAFRRSEAYSGGASALRGADGPLDVYLPGEEVHPLVRAYMEAGVAIGVPRLAEHNAGPLAGVAPNQLTIRAGRRVSASDAYLAPVAHRPNLAIVADALVHRLVLEGARVGGVEVTRDRRDEVLRAGTVVLAAGAVGSPLLLMRSGIGPPDALRAAGVNPLVQSPGVGRNLQDHLLGGPVFRTRAPLAPSRLQHSESLMYFHAEDPSRPDGAPDSVLACVVLPVVSERFARPAPGTAFTILCGVTHPESRGTLRLSGPDAEHPPLIDPAYLASDRDRRAFRSALRRAREVGAAAPLQAWSAGEILPGPGVRSDTALDAFLADAAFTHHHPAGTCRMGRDAEAVVDGGLKLRGLDNLYVVDASVIPTLPTGPINAAVVAIAEQWAAHCAPDRPSAPRQEAGSTVSTGEPMS